MLDYVIRGGTVVDGTGEPGRRADVGIRDGRIVAIGTCRRAGGHEFDAAGLVVDARHRRPAHALRRAAVLGPVATPVEPARRHDHDRRQLRLHARAASTPQDADYIRRMMAKVEGMPLAALETGVPWNWRTFADYLDALDGRHRASTSGSWWGTARSAAT